jgi:hypothetical protein
MIYVVTTVTTTKTSLMNPLFVNSIDIIENHKATSQSLEESEYSGSFFVSRR